ncbi:ricin-type beta-trefoil lectin domain protein [Streptomyces sp. NPDC046931]|uniref:ricin-type beta-trefoil lectin domain protein n=1 Tax=Streptomyces sp. NPDC046931 TaxID=3154806 RepID=UPI003410D6C2
MKDGSRRNTPDSLPSYGATDEQLAAELKKSAGKRPVHHPVGELLGRHWEAAYSYARLCADGAHPAGMLTTAAFTRLFEDSARQGGPTAAWRPQLLVAVRRLAAEWDTDHRRALLNPALRSDAAGERAAARLSPPETRRLVSRAFQRLSEPARCLLWHAEVEREELAVPAALLGIDPADAVVRLDRAREQIREACLDVHRESAPDQECRRYARLLDVFLRRSDDLLDPDLRRHMDGCMHCHHAAEQLEGFHRRLPLLLAEGVLGWGAQAYLETKPMPGEATEAPVAPAKPLVGGEPLIDPVDERPWTTPLESTAPITPADSGDRGTTARDPRGGRFPSAVPTAAGPRSTAGHKAPRRSSPRRQLALAVAAVSALVLVPLAVWSGTRSAGGAATGTGTPSDGPSPAGTNRSGSPSLVGAAADVPTGAFEGRLRNEDGGLCVGLDQDKAVAGAEAVLVSCASTATQQWAYGTDGLLRSAAAPDLCLDSHLGYSVQLASCAGGLEPEAKNVRYDFTRQGVFVPRGGQDLALTPASSDRDAGLVLKPRTGGDTQRWHVDTSNALRMQTADWGTEDASRAPAARGAGPSRSAAPARGSTPAPSPTWSTRARPTDGPSSRTASGCPDPYCPPGDQGTQGDQGARGGWGGHEGRGPSGTRGGH